MYSKGKFNLFWVQLGLMISVYLSNDYQEVSEYDQEIPQSHTADQPMAP